ncbi:hypothetical protein [Candidatus Ichthyocystis sparus]|uniref:hypothetical protein n=1 Tax=Candidatus Ichthyocystis sparus TaxID=1561004 RepID=UPI00159EED1F|nr:hypothetical protein [Candidatus Ichthyocystis sparus]
MKIVTEDVSSMSGKSIYGTSGDNNSSEPNAGGDKSPLEVVGQDTKGENREINLLNLNY